MAVFYFYNYTLFLQRKYRLFNRIFLNEQITITTLTKRQKYLKVHVDSKQNITYAYFNWEAYEREGGIIERQMTESSHFRVGTKFSLALISFHSTSALSRNLFAEFG